jgi:hypothetical protein
MFYSIGPSSLDIGRWPLAVGRWPPKRMKGNRENLSWTVVVDAAVESVVGRRPLIF